MKKVIFSICLFLIATFALLAPGGNGVDVNGSLLSSGDDSHKFERIPQWKVKKKRIVEDIKEDIVKMPQDNDSVKKAGEQKGLLGMSNSTEDLLAKISLIGLIVLIFVLYRLRSGNSRTKRRRYPKK
jgi:hypothetical protein